MDEEYHGNTPKRVKFDKPAWSSYTALRLESHYQTSELDSKLAADRLDRSELDDILQSSGLSKRHLAEIESFLKQISECIQSAENIPSKKGENLLRLKESFFPSQPSSPLNVARRIDFTYSKPSRVIKVGDAALGAIFKQSSRKYIDIAVEMPASLFEDDDALDGAYFHKRAFFLAVIASALLKDKFFKANVDFAPLDDDLLRPIIVIPTSVLQSGTKANDTGHGCIFRIIPVIPFRLFSSLDAKTNKEGDGTMAQRTSLTADRTMLACNDFITQCLTNQKAVGEASRLGNLWLESRSLGSFVSSGGFGTFEWSAMIGSMLYSLEQRKGTNSSFVSSFHLFKMALEFISTKDLHKDIQIYGCVRQGEPPLVLKHDVIFKMTKASYALLKHEAKLTLDSLKNPRALATLFSKQPGGPLGRHDVWARLPENIQPRDESLKVGWNKTILIANYLYDLLSKALGDRAKLVLISPPKQCLPSGKNTTKGSAALRGDAPFFEVAITVDPKLSRRLVDFGPPVGSDEAAHFRSFWREKAELRRFKNGEVRESVVWDAKHPVIPQVLRWVFHEYFSGIQDVTSLKIHGYDFEFFVSHIPTSGSLLSPFGQLRDSFQQLERLLRGIEGLPLHIKEISPSDPALRCTSVDISPSPPSEGEIGNAYSMLLTFESTSRWPDDLNLVQLVKISFLARLAKILNESSEVAEATVGLEDNIGTLANIGFADVLLEGGYRFRLRIKADNEVLLLKNGGVRLKPKVLPSISSMENDGRQDQDEVTERLLHHEAMNRLVQKFEVLSPTIRLVKRWLQSQLLSLHVEEECIELLCVHSFLDPTHLLPPNNPSSGFLRCLNFIANWDWKAEPCIIDFERNLSAESYKNILIKFSQARKLDPGYNKFVYFVASSVDGTGVAWCKYKPSKVIAHRITVLARSAIGAVQSMHNGDQLAKIFKPSLRDFDALIHFRKHTTNVYRNIQKTSTEIEQPQLCIDFLEELVRLFNSVLLLFYDPHDPTVAAIAWKEGNPHGLDVPSANISSIEDQKKLLALNRSAILSEIKRLGHDLIGRIEVK